MKVKRIWDDTRGSVLVEFTVTASLFLLLTFGLLQAGLLLFTQAGLQHGVEAAARCASVNYAANKLGLSQSCFIVSGTAIAPGSVTTTNIRQYAQQNSWGVNPATANLSYFSVTAGSGSPTTNMCGTATNPVPGYQVSASYPYNIMNYLFHVTLTAQSCFPISIS
jgi:Flp pilus assembly protein TadG